MVIGQQAPAGLKERLDSAYLAAARERVVGQHTSTWETEASPYSLDDLRLALGVIRLGLRSEVEWLPDDTFEAQDSDSDENEVWSAGQIVNHLGHTQITMTAWLLDLMEIDRPEGLHPLTDLTDAEEPGLLAREQSLHVLDVAERELEKLFDAIPVDTGLVKSASHPLFGETGVKGSLLFMSIHESSHLGQLRSLRN